MNSPNSAGGIVRTWISTEYTFINDHLFMMSFWLFVFDDDILWWSNTEQCQQDNADQRIFFRETYTSATGARSTITGRSFVS